MKKSQFSREGGKGSHSLFFHFALPSFLFCKEELKTITGLRLDREQEFDGADLSIHKVSASPERETNW